MGLFQKVEGSAAILSIGGVYKQVDLYTWDGALFANTSGGFVRLLEDGSTSKPKMQLKHLMLDAELFRDPLGKLYLAGGAGRAQIGAATKQHLLLKGPA